jgi:signal peptidase II
VAVSITRAGIRGATPWFGAALLIVAIDQAVKLWVLATLVEGERIALTGFFNLVLAFNPGAAFSFLADAPGWQRPLFTVFALGASIVIGVLLARHSAERRFCAGLSLILGGAVGNLVDRLRLGHVVDFLDFHAAGWHWPAFNVADSAITLGAAILIIDGFLQRDGGKPQS